MAASHISSSLNCVNQPGYLCNKVSKCSHSRVAMLKLTRLGVCPVSAVCSVTRNALFMSCVSLNIQHTGVNPENSCLVFWFCFKAHIKIVGKFKVCAHLDRRFCPLAWLPDCNSVNVFPDLSDNFSEYNVTGKRKNQTKKIRLEGAFQDSAQV